ncbi:MAG: porin family protein [Calditrichaeota bacterium]|nr:porin family protein [Calditrichota bacterium]
MKKMGWLAFAIALLVSFSSLGQAQNNLQIGLNAAGGGIGFVNPSGGIGSTISLAGNAELGTFMKDFHLVGFAQFWTKKYAEGVYWDWKWTEMVFGGGAKYYFNLENMPFKPYAGAGLAFVFSRSSWNYTGPASIYIKNSESNTNLDFGAQIFGGAEYSINPKMTAYAELRYHTDGVDFLGIYAGVLYRLK